MMATFLLNNIVSFLFLLLLVCRSSLFRIKAHSINSNIGGFSIDLIHRDSLLSPYYNPSEIPFQRWKNAFHRSVARVDDIFKQSLKQDSTKDVSSTVVANNGEYLMKISIGTPPVEILAIADTGSDLVWLQCKPCQECYKQEAPLFDPKKSSTYMDLPCESGFCDGLGDQGYCIRDVCQYSYQYGDQSFTNGHIATDTFTFGSINSGQYVSLPKKVFGCGHNNNGTFDQHGSGLVGLGGGSLSLISQLGSSIIDRKFSYCLVPLTEDQNATSRLSFGAEAEVSGENVVSTPLVAKSPDTFYFLTLEGVSVGDQRLRYKKEHSSSASLSSSKIVAEDDEGGGDGNIIIDSGTTVTWLPSGFYDEIQTAVKDSIKLTPVADPEVLKLCYESDEEDIGVPPITAHFSGADLKLNPLNTFVRVSDNLVCFAFMPATDLAIFGNIAQMNFLVGYDFEAGKVTFKPTDCTNQ